MRAPERRLKMKKKNQKKIYTEKAMEKKNKVKKTTATTLKEEMFYFSQPSVEEFKK